MINHPAADTSHIGIGGTTKKEREDNNMATFSGIGKLLKDVIFSDLTTSSKNVIGAINELNTGLPMNIFPTTQDITITAEQCKNGLIPFYINAWLGENNCGMPAGLRYVGVVFKADSTSISILAFARSPATSTNSIIVKHKYDSNKWDASWKSL